MVQHLQQKLKINMKPIKIDGTGYYLISKFISPNPYMELGEDMEFLQKVEAPEFKKIILNILSEFHPVSVPIFKEKLPNNTEHFYENSGTYDDFAIEIIHRKHALPKLLVGDVHDAYSRLNNKAYLVKRTGFSFIFYSGLVYESRSKEIIAALLISQENLSTFNWIYSILEAIKTWNKAVINHPKLKDKMIFVDKLSIDIYNYYLKNPLVKLAVDSELFYKSKTKYKGARKYFLNSEAIDIVVDDLEQVICQEIPPLKLKRESPFEVPKDFYKIKESIEKEFINLNIESILLKKYELLRERSHKLFPIERILSGII